MITVIDANGDEFAGTLIHVLANGRMLVSWQAPNVVRRRWFAANGKELRVAGDALRRYLPRHRIEVTDV